jgi:hypothetical protein
VLSVTCFRCQERVGKYGKDGKNYDNDKSGSSSDASSSGGTPIGGGSSGGSSSDEDKDNDYDRGGPWKGIGFPGWNPWGLLPLRFPGFGGWNGWSGWNRGPGRPGGYLYKSKKVTTNTLHSENHLICLFRPSF